MPEYSDIELAIEYVSSAPPGMNRAVFDKASNQFYYASDATGENEIPEDIDEDSCIEMPHKNELELGHNLALQFVEVLLPEEDQTVRAYFTQPGAYKRFKSLLESRQLLERWYDYEASAQREAIKGWCEANGLTITPGNDPPASPAPDLTDFDRE